MHDGTVTFDYMPSQFITFRLEEGYRYSDTPYWTGRGGITRQVETPARPRNTSVPARCFWLRLRTQGLLNAELACGAGSSAGTSAGLNSIWWPDLRTNQTVRPLRSWFALVAAWAARLHTREDGLTN